MLGQHIRNLRIARGISQKQLAGREMTRTYISLIESGKRHPSGSMLGVLAGRLGVTVLDLENESTIINPVAQNMWNWFSNAQRHFDTGEYECARLLLTRLLESTYDQEIVSRAGSLLARTLYKLHEKGRASEEYCKVLMKLEQSYPERQMSMTIYMEFAAMAFQHEDYVSALHCYLQVTEQCAILKSYSLTYAQACMYLGSVYLRLGQMDNSASRYEEAYKLFGEIGETSEQALCALGLSALYSEGSNWPQASLWIDKALFYSNNINSETHVLALHNKAIIQTALNEYETAHNLLNHCLYFYCNKNQKEKQISVLEDLAKLSLSMGDHAKAHMYCEQAIRLLVDLNNTFLTGRIYRLMGVIEKGYGDLIRASQYLHVSYLLFLPLNMTKESTLSAELLRDVREKLTRVSS